MAELKTVEQFQKEALVRVAYSKEPSGVECPNCATELLIRARFPQADPPIMLVDCDKCSYSISLLDA